MKKTNFRCRRAAGFTLIELLVVIAIIGILAGLLLPVLAAVKKTAAKRRALYEMKQIEAAITQYETTYSRMPLSTLGAGSLNPACPDFTYGTFTIAQMGPSATFMYRNGTSMPQIGNVDASGSPATYYQANNSELMAMLMDQVTLQDGTTPTANAGHIKNPQQIHFLDAKMSGDNISPGVGTDLVYRDPWSNPYIVSMDVNGDNRVRDGFYRSQQVSQKTPGSAIGYNGLNNTVDPSGSGNGDYYEANGTVMVWSLGPDGAADRTQKAAGTAGNPNTPNKDNIITW